MQGVAGKASQANATTLQDGLVRGRSDALQRAAKQMPTLTWHIAALAADLSGVAGPFACGTAINGRTASVRTGLLPCGLRLPVVSFSQ